jgi:hypothetical protein
MASLLDQKKRHRTQSRRTLISPSWSGVRDSTRKGKKRREKGRTATFSWSILIETVARVLMSNVPEPGRRSSTPSSWDRIRSLEPCSSKDRSESSTDAEVRLMRKGQHTASLPEGEGEKRCGMREEETDLGVMIRLPHVPLLVGDGLLRSGFLEPCKIGVCRGEDFLHHLALHIRNGSETSETSSGRQE